MLLEDNDLQERLESPLNLLNRLRRITSGGGTNGKDHTVRIPALPPTADELIPDLTTKITNGAIKGKAIDLISQCMDDLKTRMPEVTKPKELAAIASEMTKVITAMEPKNEISRSDMPQIVIYAPRIQTEDTFNIIELNEV